MERSPLVGVQRVQGLCPLQGRVEELGDGVGLAVHGDGLAQESVDDL